MINATDNIYPNCVASLACDDASDVADLEQYAKDNNLKLGSTCLVVDTGQVYAMKSDFTWKEI